MLFIKLCWTPFKMLLRVPVIYDAWGGHYGWYVRFPAARIRWGFRKHYPKRSCISILYQHLNSITQPVFHETQNISCSREQYLSLPLVFFFFPCFFMVRWMPFILCFSYHFFRSLSNLLDSSIIHPFRKHFRNTCSNWKALIILTWEMTNTLRTAFWT